MAEVTVLLRMEEDDADVLRASDSCRVVAVDHYGNESTDMPATIYRVGSLPDVPLAGLLSKPPRCPRCDSKAPNLHPAMQADGGEVNLCLDPWHDDEVTAKAREQTA
jgi:hypothetical protein